MFADGIFPRLIISHVGPNRYKKVLAIIQRSDITVKPQYVKIRQIYCRRLSKPYFYFDLRWPGEAIFLKVTLVKKQ